MFFSLVILNFLILLSVFLSRSLFHDDTSFRKSLLLFYFLVISNNILVYICYLLDSSDLFLVGNLLFLFNGSYLFMLIGKKIRKTFILYYLIFMLVLIYSMIYVSYDFDLDFITDVNRVLTLICCCFYLFFAYSTYKFFLVNDSDFNFIKNRFAFVLFIFLVFYFVFLLLMLIKNELMFFSNKLFVYSSIGIVIIFLILMLSSFYTKNNVTNLISLDHLIVLIDKQEPSVSLENTNSRDQNENNYLTLSDKELTNYKYLVNRVLIEDKLFLDQNLNLTLLSEKTGIAKHHLSFLFSKTIASSFNMYVNRLRVEYAIDYYRRNLDKKLTIEQWSEKSGFNSRVSFYRAFKKVMGFTPSEFVDSINS